VHWRPVQILGRGGVRRGGHLVGDVSSVVRVSAKMAVLEQMGMQDVIEGGSGEQEVAAVNLGTKTG